MCLNPRTIRLADGRTLKVGCGHCLQCLKQYQDNWTARLNEEAKSWKPQNGLLPVVFFTLKYRNETIPCTYLVLTERGIILTSEKPDYCQVYEFWTDTARNKVYPWQERRKELLSMYAREFNRIAAEHSYDVDADMFEIATGAYEVEKYDVEDPRYYGGVHHCVRFVSAASLDIPEYLDFEPLNGNHSLLFGKLPVSRVDQPTWHDSALFAFEFHSVEKTGVQDWLKRCRIRFERSHPDWGECSPRFNPDWTDSDGASHRLPDCAIPKTFKYFITSEYGPWSHRPHLHGVLFGVTYDEFKSMFMPDWEKQYGSVDFSAFDPSRGAMSYLAKYCSKGGYDSPYCSTDFFYTHEDGSAAEYHSKRYEYCITDFGCPWNIVRPTFHLISKGLGVRYAFDAEVQRYFGVMLSEYVTDGGTRKYSTSDSSESLAIGVLPSLGVEDACFLKCSRTVKTELLDNGDLLIRKYDYNDHLVGESVVKAESIINAAVEELTLSKKYNRTYVRKKSQINGREVNFRCISCWHLLGKNPSVVLEPCTTSIALPRYYRQWLLSPLASGLRASAAKRLHPDLDEVRTAVLQSDRPENEKMAVIESLDLTDKMQRKATETRLRRSAQSFYLRPTGIVDID